MNNFELEDSELNFYCNGKSYSIPLTDTQLVIVLKILGMELGEDTHFSCYSDESLKALAKMKGNPLHLKEI